MFTKLAFYLPLKSYITVLTTVKGYVIIDAITT